MNNLPPVPAFTPANLTHPTNEEWNTYRDAVDAFFIQINGAITAIDPTAAVEDAPAGFTVNPAAPMARLNVAALVTGWLYRLQNQLTTITHDAALAAAALQHANALAAAAQPPALPAGQPVGPPAGAPPLNINILLNMITQMQQQQAQLQQQLVGAMAPPQPPPAAIPRVKPRSLPSSMGTPPSLAHS